jgi:hypothetical protein
MSLIRPVNYLLNYENWLVARMLLLKELVLILGNSIFPIPVYNSSRFGSAYTALFLIFQLGPAGLIIDFPQMN